MGLGVGVVRRVEQKRGAEWGGDVIPQRTDAEYTANDPERTERLDSV